MTIKELIELLQKQALAQGGQTEVYYTDSDRFRPITAVEPGRVGRSKIVELKSTRNS